MTPAPTPPAVTASTSRRRTTSRRVALAATIAGTGAVMAATTLAVAPDADAAPKPRAMWVWSFADAATTVDFATSHGITQMFVAVPPRVTTSTQLPKLRDLSARARAAGVRLDALGGDPGWVDNQDWVVTNWLKPALSTGLFTGVHVDMEPYATRAWSTDRAGVVTRYLQTLDKLRANAGAAPLEADIPFWFWQVPAGNRSTLDREILKRTAAVTVMAYRNTATGPDGTIAVAATELAHAQTLGKPVRIGQETNYVGAGRSDVKQTFFGRSERQMQTQLALVDAAAGTHPNYAGIAIHDYRGYAAITS